MVPAKTMTARASAGQLKKLSFVLSPGFGRRQLTILTELWLVMLFNYLVVRILSAIPDCMNNDFIISNLIVDNVILNY